MKLRTFITVLLCLVGLMLGELKLATASPAKIVGEFLAGGVCAIAGVVGTFELGEYLESRRGDPAPSYIGPLQYGTAVCANALGSSLGVYLIGNIGDETGSFLATLAGSALGALLTNGCCLGIYIPGSRRHYDPSEWGPDDPPELLLVWGLLGSLISAPVGAVIGFNKTNRHELSSELDSHAAPPIYFNLVRGRF